MAADNNPEQELAWTLLESTGVSLFLTGKAGTGKTTFLRRLRAESPKRMVVAAPTGVAALNAGGVTLHSLFQLPFGPQVPGGKREMQRFTGEKIAILRSMDLLVIDEISMVRADVLDGVSEVLCRFRDRERPFGGVQLLLIGDLQQLSPVARDEEWALLREHYETPYFFSSQALRSLPYESVALKHVYRQSDPRFLELLNQVRENRLDQDGLDALNQRYIPGYTPPEGCITLVTHNRQADRLNAFKLQELKTKERSYNGLVDGEFPEALFPTDEPLRLKVKAQVMFLRNDPDGRYYNGKIGTVAELRSGTVLVRCEGETEPIELEPVQWENMSYSLNPSTQEIEGKILGTFTQLPLRLAWAITIHKSQGLTFERAVIEAGASFAHGQVYVALSRCKTLEGLVLGSPLQARSVIQDQTVQGYTHYVEQKPSPTGRIRDMQAAYQYELLKEWLDFSPVWKAAAGLSRVTREKGRALRGIDETFIRGLGERLRQEGAEVGDKFLGQAGRLLREGRAEENPQLADRLRKAGGYFQKMASSLAGQLQGLAWSAETKEARQDAVAHLEALLRGCLYISWCAAWMEKNDFSTAGFLKARARALLDSSNFRYQAPARTQDSDLLARLLAWRGQRALDYALEPTELLGDQALAEVSRRCPSDMAALAKTKGIGKRKAAELGEEILAVVRAYQNG